MARLALKGLGIATADIDRAEEMYRARDKERLQFQIASGDIRAARTETAQRFPWGNDGK
jgi:CPA2 family monovalent cation:H+ antiporter-2/glutathione-regulated potassium-efflux system protein KefB